MKHLSSLLATLTMGFLLVTPAAAKSWQHASPDGRLVATIDDTHGITYAVAFDGRKLIISSPISMTIGNDKTTLIGTSLRVVG